MTADLLQLKRLNEIIKAMEKMHHGLLAAIDAHIKLEETLTRELSLVRQELEEVKAQLKDVRAG